MNPASVLVVDDDLLWAELMASQLTEQGFLVRTAGSLATARQMPATFDLLISDWLLPGEESAAVLVREMRAGNPGMKAILISGLPKEDIETELGSERADAILEKPVDVDEVLALAKRMVPLSAT